MIKIKSFLTKEVAGRWPRLVRASVKRTMLITEADTGRSAVQSVCMGKSAPAHYLKFRSL